MRPRSGDMLLLQWHSEAPNRLTVGDMEFNVAALLPARNGQRMVIRKTREMVETLADVIDHLRPRNVVELGIGQGGSTAYLAQLTQPKKLVAIEKDATRVPALDDYIASHSLRDTVKTFYGVDQADRSALDKIIGSEFHGEPLDLVVDDASHLLHESRVSLNRLFPRLRPGGVYMIEDWAWGHYPTENVIPEENDRRDQWFASAPTGAPLTVLVFELVMTCASGRMIIDDVLVDNSFVRVRRGSADLETTFDISSSYFEGPVKLLAP